MNQKVPVFPIISSSPDYFLDLGTQTSQTNLGILVNLDESPDKNLSHCKQVLRPESQVVKDADSVFDSPANPFQLAWDVIQQEALNLADNILQDKEKPISPRKSTLFNICSFTIVSHTFIMQ